MNPLKAIYLNYLENAEPLELSIEETRSQENLDICTSGLVFISAVEDATREFDQSFWEKAAVYPAYRTIITDYQNGYRYGNSTARNDPVSQFAVARLKSRNFDLPDGVPHSTPEPCRDPRDR